MDEIEQWEETNAEAFEYLDSPSKSMLESSKNLQADNQSSNVIKQLQYEEELTKSKKRKISDQSGSVASKNDELFSDKIKKAKHVPFQNEFIAVTSYLGRRVLVSLRPEEKQELTTPALARKSVGTMLAPTDGYRLGYYPLQSAI